MIKVDIHNHLGSNGDNPGFDATIDAVHKRLGDNSAFGIANSDDSRYERFIEQSGGKYNREVIQNGRAIYVPEKKVLVVKCQEMFTKDGHILAIATPYGRNVKTKNAKDAIKEAKDLGAILDAVHPYYLSGIGDFLERNPELWELFSTWEAYNGSAEFSFPGVLPKDSNEKSMMFYLKNLMHSKELIMGASSSTDGHTVGVIGKCYTEIQAEENFMQGNFLENLDSAFKYTNSLSQLHTEPNRRDAAVHAVKMGLVKLGLRKD
ncbi:MAG: hypothetical protein AABW47_04815 [Nanoarchaeota archaeon]